MKTKKLRTKLSLNKATVATIGSDQLNRVIGGAPSIDTMCPTWGGDSCNTVCYSNFPPAYCQDPSICDCTGPFNTDCCDMSSQILC